MGTLVEAVCHSAHSTVNNVCSLLPPGQDAATRGRCHTGHRDAPPAHPTAPPLLPLRTAGWVRCRLGTTPAVWARCRASTTRPHWTARRTRPFGACHHQEVERFALELYRVGSVQRWPVLSQPCHPLPPNNRAAAAALRPVCPPLPFPPRLARVTMKALAMPAAELRRLAEAALRTEFPPHVQMARYERAWSRLHACSRKQVWQGWWLGAWFRMPGWTPYHRL